MQKHKATWSQNDILGSDFKQVCVTKWKNNKLYTYVVFKTQMLLLKSCILSDLWSIWNYSMMHYITKLKAVLKQKNYGLSKKIYFSLSNWVQDRGAIPYERDGDDNPRYEN